MNIPRTVTYLAVFIIGFIAVSLWSFWLAVRPPRISIPGTPADYGLAAEELTIETADGLTLSSWLIRGQNHREAGPAVILLHGYPAEKSDMLSIARALHPSFTTLLLDLRYFGKSQGRSTTLGLREREDLSRAIEVLAARAFQPIGVFGFSLGGAVGILTAAEDERIKAVAAYASFSDLRTLGYETYSSLWILKYPLVELMILWGKLFLGGDVTRPSPSDIALKLSIPVLLIHSRQDEQISFRHAELLRQSLAKNQKAEFLFQERGRHGELPPDFDERLIEFFKRHLATPSP